MIATLFPGGELELELRGDMKAGYERKDIVSGVVAWLLLAMMAVLAGGAALRESVTIDEVTHIGAGVSYLQRLDLRMNPEHPPLVKVLAAVPLELRGVHADYQHISWTISGKFFPAFLGQWVFGEWLLEKWNDPATVLMWARLPMLLLTLVLGWTVYALGKRLGGVWGGLLCLSVFVGTPAFLTFGPLVHTDIAVTLFSVLALWTFAEMWQEPSRENVVVFGMSLAAALLSKFTAGVLLFAFLAFVLSLRWRAVASLPTDKDEARRWKRARWQATLKGILCAAVIVYAFYFIFSWNQPSDALYRLGTGPAAMFIRRMLMPPLLYLRGVFWVVLTGKRPTFLLGHTYPHGVWFYFPVVFALKSALGFLGLLILALAVAVIRKARGGMRNGAAVPEQFAMHWRALWIGLLIVTGACLLSPLDISIRHFSVPLALLILLLAPLPRMLKELRGPRSAGGALGAAATVALAGSCLFTALHAYPFYLPYINSLGLGHPVYALLNDSNVDWNQSLPEVRRFAENHGLREIGLTEYGFTDPTVTVPQAQVWNCQKPAPADAGKWVAISANDILDAHNCVWLMEYPHEVLGGGSMYAVHLPDAIPPAGSAGGPPLPSAFREFFGAPFDVQAFFLHVSKHPEDLPLVVKWMETAFKGSGQPPKAIPKFPWEH